MKTPFEPRATNPVHCCCCIQTGANTPATHSLTGPERKPKRSTWVLYGCDEHADEIDKLGLNAVKQYQKTQDVAPRKRGGHNT